MRADMDQRVEALCPEPEVEGDIGMARGAGEVVIVVRPRRHLAAFGLQGNDGAAPADRVKAEVTVFDRGVGFGVAPGREKRLA